MLMIPQPFELNLEAFKNAALYAQQLSEEAQAVEFQPLTSQGDIGDSQGQNVEQEATYQKGAETFRLLMQAYEGLRDSGTAYIKSMEAFLDVTPFSELWKFAAEWAKKPTYAAGLSEDVVSWAVTNFDPKGDSEAMIRTTYKVKEQVMEWHAKVNKTIKRSQAAYAKRQRVAVPQTEAEMVKRAERFAKQNRKVISELSRI